MKYDYSCECDAEKYPLIERVVGSVHYYENKIAQARDLVRQLIELAENTLSTVRVSSDLANLIQRSETLIDQVITLQAPDLVPFENLELKKEFENVTSRIRSIN